MNASLDDAHLFASDRSATVGFFRTMFGATVIWDETAAGVRVVRLALGGAFIVIFDQPPKAPRGGAVHHLGIATDDLDALVAKMKANGFEFRNPIHDDPKFRYVMVSGPDDLLIELFQSLEPERWQVKV